MDVWQVAKMGVIKEGFLTKEGGSIKTWKKRWFVLTEDGILAYFKKKGGEQMGKMDLKEGCTVQEVSYKKKKNCFEAKTPGRTYHLIAENGGDMNAWMEQIKKITEGGGSDSAAAPKKEEVKPTHVVKKADVDDFQVTTVIGKGSFGRVLLVKHKEDGRIFAMKVLNKAAIIERNELEHTKAEKSILMKLDHPFLVKLYYSFQTPEKLYFIMDYVNGGELFYHLQKEKKFPPERVRFYAAEIVLGLSYLHNEGVIYRDLKPENLLLSADGHMCMTDFGISKEGLAAKDDRTATFCGTPEYLAPEVLRGKGYGKGVDWWSFGTLVFEMLTGLPPFYSEDVQLMYNKIMNTPLQIPPEFDEDTASLLNGLLERDPEKRLSDPEDIQKHPYFKTIDWDKLLAKEITPPYIPPVTQKDSTDMIDPSFTQEDPESQTEASAISNADQANFDGFTFVAGSALKP